ncbi:unnamed protein product [Ixodes persulcatus]
MKAHLMPACFLMCYSKKEKDCEPLVGFHYYTEHPDMGYQIDSPIKPEWQVFLFLFIWLPRGPEVLQRGVGHINTLILTSI